MISGLAELMGVRSEAQSLGIGFLVVSTCLDFRSGVCFYYTHRRPCAPYAVLGLASLRYQPLARLSSRSLGWCNMVSLRVRLSTSLSPTLALLPCETGEFASMSLEVLCAILMTLCSCA